MYLMPRSTILFTTFAPMHSVCRYGVTLLILGVVASAWYFGIYTTLSTHILDMRNDITHVRAQEKITLSDTTQTALETQVDLARCSLRDYNSIWKTKGIEFLLEQVTTAGLAFIASDVTTKQREPWCIQDTITLRLHGSCDQISRFFSLISQQDSAIVGESCEITSTDGKEFSLVCSLTALTVCSCE